MKFLPFVVRNLIRNRRRSLLTAMTLAVASFIFAVLVSVPASMDRILTDAAATLRLVTYNTTGKWYGLPAGHCNVIRRLPDVVACTPVLYFGGVYRDPRDLIIGMTTDVDTLDITFADLQLPPSVLDQLRRNRMAALAGRTLIERQGWRVGEPLTLRGDIGGFDLDFMLVGEIPEGRYPNTLMAQREYLVEAREARGIAASMSLPEFLVTKVRSAEGLTRAAELIDATFRNSDYPTSSITEQQALTDYISGIGNVRGIVYGVATILLATILLIAANATSMSLRDRVAEIGVLRALGFTPLLISGLFLLECALVGVAGGVGGAFPALLFFHKGVTLGVVTGSGGSFSLQPATALEAVAVTVALSMLSGIIPVTAALKTAAAESLRKTV